MSATAEARREAAVEAALDRAAASCQGRGAQLTELRRQVLRLVLSSPHPVGAYALLDQLRAARPGAAPPTVYRALDFLQEQGLVHRVERLNAFVGCAGPRGTKLVQQRIGAHRMRRGKHQAQHLPPQLRQLRPAPLAGRRRAVQRRLDRRLPP